MAAGGGSLAGIGMGKHETGILNPVQIVGV